MAEANALPAATDRQQAAILAGLNLLFHRQRGETPPDGDAFEDLLTSGGSFDALDSAEIDELIESINTDGIAVGREADA